MGTLDENEDFTGYGEFELPFSKMKYQGEFKEGLFDGQGRIIH